MWQPTQRCGHMLSLPQDTSEELLTCLGLVELCRVEAVCSFFRERLRDTATIALPRPLGQELWRIVGGRTFCGLELRSGFDFRTFEEFRHAVSPITQNAIYGGESVKMRSVGWKCVCKQFYEASVSIQDISSWILPALCFRTDLLKSCPGQGVYVELETIEAGSGLLVGVSGGHSDVNRFVFEPEHGRVRETALVPLSASSMLGKFKTRSEELLPPSRYSLFSGRVGFYLSGTHIAFFRMLREDDLSPRELAATQQRPSTCQATSFVLIPGWAQGQRLSLHSDPLLRVVHVGGSPPLWPPCPR